MRVKYRVIKGDNGSVDAPAGGIPGGIRYFSQS